MYQRDDAGGVDLPAAEFKASASVAETICPARGLVPSLSSRARAGSGTRRLLVQSPGKVDHDIRGRFSDHGCGQFVERPIVHSCGARSRSI